MIELTLPWPPSVNSYWRHPTTGRLAGRHLISEKGRAYRADVCRIVGLTQKITGRVSVMIYASPPDKRRRDLDNLFKSLLDSLTHAGVWDDDAQIDRLCIERIDAFDGVVVVQITDIPAHDGV